MWLLVHYKVKTGKALNSDAIIADAACSRVCMLLSLVLLLASVGYELTGIGILDSIGSQVIAWFSVSEGKEAFQKAKGLQCSCHDK
jgi:divalent metal cation (Fe/Co/Zn/Cd) transporter